jgi:hemerythrin-like domain-containing protein
MVANGVPCGPFHPEDFRDPITFLAAEHDRQLGLWKSLERLADETEGNAARSQATAILTYLDCEMAHHIADEEENFFPALKRRAKYEDGFDEIVIAMSEEHQAGGEARRPIIEALRSIAAGNVPEDREAFARNARQFASLQRRHLTWENDVILDLARKRLEPDDLLQIGRSMARRRGVTHPEDVTETVPEEGKPAEPTRQEEKRGKAGGILSRIFKPSPGSRQ